MQYSYADDGIIRRDKAGQDVYLSNFNAIITGETVYTDGRTQTTILTITGKLGKTKLPEIQVPATEFAAMSWVAANWGVTPVISPVPSAERDLRAAIQYQSKPKRKTVYTHTGWTRVGKRDAYLTKAGAIHARGYDHTTDVQLPAELQRYSVLPDNKTYMDGIRATCRLSQITARKDLIWPLIAAAIRAPLGEADYALHLAGQTGTFKSELVSLIQSHYGPEMDARHLPGNWSSTANALEAQSYKAKDAVFVVDDFVPYGTAWQVRAYQKTADQLIRGAGNQAGRARLTDVSNLQTTMYPRCLIISTGEDIPQGHSIRARMFILETSPGDITPADLTDAQSQREKYSAGIAAYIQYLAQQDIQRQRGEHKRRAREIRDENRDLGHTRTPAMLGDLIAAVERWIVFVNRTGAATPAECSTITKEATAALKAAAATQDQHLRTADPTEAFVDAIRLLFQTNQIHLRTVDGGIPENPTKFGWTENAEMSGVKTYTCHGTRIGWIDCMKRTAYLSPDVAYSLAQKNSRGQIVQTKTTLFKRLRDAGVLCRVDDTRNRNTIRVTCEGQQRSVLAIATPTLSETAEE